MVGTVSEGATATQTVADDGYSLAVLAYPTERSLGSLGLVGAGFTGSTRHRTSDKIYFYNAEIQTFTVFVWYDTGSGFWRYADGSYANSLQVIPGRVMLFERKSRGSSFDWTQSRPYTVPMSTP